MAASLRLTWLSMTLKWVGRKSTVGVADWKQYTRPTCRAATMTAWCVFRCAWCTS
jgi:hypothetical protein